MIILPDKNSSRGKFLMPMPRREWMPPSQAEWKDQFNNSGTTIVYRVSAKICDGHTVWCGKFNDREDFDAFLFAIAAGNIRQQPSLWRLPTPQWYPEISSEVSYEFATLSFLTTTGSNQTFTSPRDWTSSNNTIECIGNGGNGGAIAANRSAAGGGGAGAYSKIVNFTFATPGTTTTTYYVGAANGAVGTYFALTSAPGFGSITDASCYAQEGSAGSTVTNGIAGGGQGGAATSGNGSTRYDGGDGGRGENDGATEGAGGGGGAGGPNGAGNNGGGTLGIANLGGSGDAGSGGAGGNASNGGNGSEFDFLFGSGGGGAGRLGTGTITGYSGGTYGAGGGGVALDSGTPTGGAASQGLIVITYYPANRLGNLAMMGM